MKKMFPQDIRDNIFAFLGFRQAALAFTCAKPDLSVTIEHKGKRFSKVLSYCGEFNIRHFTRCDPRTSDIKITFDNSAEASFRPVVLEDLFERTICFKNSLLNELWIRAFDYTLNLENTRILWLDVCNGYEKIRLGELLGVEKYTRFTGEFEMSIRIMRK